MSCVPWLPSRVNINFDGKAGDADSLMSALTHAYCHQQSCPQNQLHVPIMSIPRSDIHLRPETLRLLQSAGVDPANLIFLDELNFTDLGAAFDSASLHLLDHNAKAASLPPFPGDVVDIVDHHSDQNEHTATAQHRVIAFDEQSQKSTAGSCCTLVAEEYSSRGVVI